MYSELGMQNSKQAQDIFSINFNKLEYLSNKLYLLECTTYTNSVRVLDNLTFIRKFVDTL